MTTKIKEKIKIATMSTVIVFIVLANEIRQNKLIRGIKKGGKEEAK